MCQTKIKKIHVHLWLAYIGGKIRNKVDPCMMGRSRGLDGPICCGSNPMTFSQASLSSLLPFCPTKYQFWSGSAFAVSGSGYEKTCTVESFWTVYWIFDDVRFGWGEFKISNRTEASLVPPKFSWIRTEGTGVKKAICEPFKDRKFVRQKKTGRGWRKGMLEVWFLCQIKCALWV